MEGTPSVRGRLSRAGPFLFAPALVALCLLPIGSHPQLLAPAQAGGSSAAARAAGALRPAPDAAPSAAAAELPAPVRLTVQAAGIDAAIEPVGVDGDGRMAPPSAPDRVGWYRPGVVPGDAGSAVLDGHLDWWTGQAVFGRLGHLRPGDEILVTRADSSSVRFAVSWSGLYPYNARADELFSRSGTPSIALITCAGAWNGLQQTYQQRLVVRATYAPKPLAPPPEAN